MAEQQVPVVRTVVTLRDYIRAIIAAWHTVDSGPCTKGACAVLWAQHFIETGGGACWNFNVGNSKHVAGDGFDYMCLNGVWEGVTPAAAAKLLAAGRVILDPSPNHAKAVDPEGKGEKVSVIYPPPQPESRFRAFPSLDVAMAEHLKLIVKRFTPAWPWVIAGDYRQFAHALKAGRDMKENTGDDYFTANANAYADGMGHAYLEAMTSSAWDDATEAALQDAIVTVRDMDNPASSPTIHVLSYPLGGEPDPDAA